MLAKVKVTLANVKCTKLSSSFIILLAYLVKVYTLFCQFIVLFLTCQVQRDASFGTGPARSETGPAVLPEPAVPQVADRAPGRGEREGPEDPVHLSEGKEGCVSI